jgi:serine/threonine-protein kinase
MKERIGRYKIEAELGEGGMGAVYRAHDPMLERQVAIKVMSPALASDQNFVQRFLLEARAVARIEHPNIVSVYDADMADGLYYLVMEYVSGGSLEEAMQRGGLHLPQIAQILEEVAAGLDYAHQHGMVHRDIKPNNILFDEQGTAHLADFALVKSDQVSLTQVGQTFGTPAYMAPEQIEGQQIGPYTDVYALAIVTYQMLTGQLPFDGSILTSLNPTLPPAVQAVVLKGMAKNPSERYGSAGAFAQALRHAIQSPPSEIATAQAPSSEATIILDKQPSQATEQSAGYAATERQSQVAHASDSNSQQHAHHEEEAAQSGQQPAPSTMPWLKIALGAGGVLMLLLVWAISSLGEPAEPTPESAAIVSTATVAASPTQAPEPTEQPTTALEPTASPTSPPTPTTAPTLAPTSTLKPTLPREPTAEPTLAPEPTAEPTLAPEPTAEPTLPPESATQADNSTAADDYGEYTTIVDDTGRLQVEVPIEWNGINSFNWFFNEQEVGPGLTASSDLDALFNGWTVPWLFFGISESLVEQITVEDLLDNYSYAEECTESSERTEYNDGLYTGYYDLWGTCGDSEAAMVVIAATPPSNAFIVLIQIKVIEDRDIQTFERIVETFTVE